MDAVLEGSESGSRRTRRSFPNTTGEVEVPRSEQTSNDYETLLKDFRALPGRVERPRTFMEIAGYPHYENVCSNILAFFMDPEESHGLGTLVLDALASVGNIAANGGVWGNVSVEREVVTRAGNRVDILITSDDHAVLIENKIFAAVHNPFPDYSRFLDGLARGRAEPPDARSCPRASRDCVCSGRCAPLAW